MTKIIGFLKQKFLFVKKIKFLFRLYIFIFGYKYRKKEKEVFNTLKKIETYNERELYTLQEVKLLNLLNYSFKYVKYYKELFNKNNIDIQNISSFKQIPILTKNIIRKNEDSLISNKYDKIFLDKRNTGGSTGEPLEFYSDSLGGYNDNAHHWYLYSLMGYEKGDIIIGSGGTVIPKELRDKHIYWVKESKGSVWGDYDFSVLYISDLNIHYYIEKFLEIRPSILRGYPSFFDKLATYIIQNDIEITFNIKGINLTAEMCLSSQRINIEQAFNSTVYFEYGHTEISLYCYTKDDTYIYYSSPIYGYIEVLNEYGKDVDIGEIGNIIVTGFNNYGMPFIRYDTGDMGELCYRNGGIIHFNKILGRNQDYIIDKNNQKVFLTALIFGQHLKAFNSIIQWQFIQDTIGIVQINIIKDEFYNKKDEKEILYNFQSVTDIELIFNYVKDIPLTKRGKHLFLIQKLEGNNES